MRAQLAILVSVLLYTPLSRAQEAATTTPGQAASAEPAEAAPAEPAEAAPVEPPASRKPRADGPDEYPDAIDPGKELGSGTETSPTAEGVPLTPAELEALGFDASGGGEVSSLDTDVHLSGFMDFGISRMIAKEDSVNTGFQPAHTNFYVGNFNLYLSKNLSETFRTMGEVRFTYAPNGGALGADTSNGTPTTEFPEYANYAGQFKWGGVEIERVYLEWAPSRYFAVRAGQFLTPYGIWNVDHGSPTYIPVQRPYAVDGILFPERQTGFEFFGRWDATNSGTLGYHVTLSNGGGPINEYRDLDDNKAVGGRLYWEQYGIGTLKFGGSIYYGEDTDATPGIRPDGMGALEAFETIHRQFKVLSIAADIKWQWQGLLLQAEWVSQQRKYTNEGRQAVFNRVAQQTGFPIDNLSWGTYGIAGYRFSWFGIMPYVMASYTDQVDAEGLRIELTGLAGGVNIRPIDAVVLKLEYQHSFLGQEFAGSSEPFKYIQAQAAWAF